MDVVFSRVGGSSQLSDFCPSQQVSVLHFPFEHTYMEQSNLPHQCFLSQGFSNLICDNPNNDRGSGTGNIFAQTFGEESRCVFTTGRWTVQQVSTGSTFVAFSSGAGCYQVRGQSSVQQFHWYGSDNCHFHGIYIISTAVLMVK